MEQQFRVRSEGSARQDTRIRVFFFSVVVLLLLLLALSAVIRDHSFGNKLGKTLAGIAIAVLVAGIVGAFVVSNRMSVQRMKQSCVWKLTESELVRSREGWPDERIGLSERASLCSRPGWLVLDSSDSGQKILIPEDVERFQMLRSELVKHYPVLPSPPQEGSFWILLTIAVAIACCVLVLSKADTMVKVAAVSALLLLQGWQSIRTGLAMRKNPKRVLVWSVLVYAWIVPLAAFGYLIWKH